MNFRIRIDGVPVAETRPRFKRTKKGVRTHPVRATADSKEKVRKLAEDAMKGREKLQGPLEVHILAMFPCTKKRYRKKNPALPRFKDTGPDIDNIAKHYLDGLLASGIVADDDNQVVSLLVTKIELGQDTEPYTTINIFEMFPKDEVNLFEGVIRGALTRLGEVG